jgi:hypothetical protein
MTAINLDKAKIKYIATVSDQYTVHSHSPTLAKQ